MNKNKSSENTGKRFFDKSDCFDIPPDRHLGGEILVLKSKFLLKPYNVPEYQFVLCRADNRHSLFVEFIIDDTTSLDYDREDFEGVIKPWNTPDWVTERMNTRTARRISKQKSTISKAKRYADATANEVVLRLDLASQEELDKIRSQKTKPDLYKLTYEEAENLGLSEVIRYVTSFRLNVKCAAFMRNAVNAWYDDEKPMRTIAEHAIKTFGYDRVCYVLAITVHHFIDDIVTYMTFPAKIRTWADMTVIAAGVSTDEEKEAYFTADCTVSQLTCLINHVYDIKREELEEKRRKAELKQAEREAKKAKRKNIMKDKGAR